MIAVPVGILAAAQPGGPAKEEQPAAQTPGAESGEPFQVDGFRSARWGMTDAQVKTAIRKDFNIPPEKVQTEENASERTAVMTVTVGDLLEGAGKARVSYIFGYASKKLIQVNIVWGTTIDPQIKPDRIIMITMAIDVSISVNPRS